jgi:uncharacterized protein (DUF486 family)
MSTRFAQAGAFAVLTPIVLLAISNVIMNVAWYANLKAPGRAMWLAIIGAWLIALGEYVFAVPANRIGIQAWSLAELKTIATVFSLVGFVVVAWFMFGQKPGLNQITGFALMCLGAWFVFRS